jgi:hypothetical protein
MAEHHQTLLRLSLLLPVLTAANNHATTSADNNLLRHNQPTTTALPGVNPIDAPLGTHHRCAYTGKAFPVELSLTSKQLDSSEEFYYGKSRDANFYQHLFVADECSNGLPPSSHACFSTLRVGRHCGPDEDWSVIAPDEFDGPGVMWRNNEPCYGGEDGVHKSDVTVVADFFCPTESECIHLHRCSFEGAPTASTKKLASTLTSPSTVKGRLNTNAAFPEGNEGYFEHVFKPEECSNGIPPVAGGAGSSLNDDVACMTSIRWAESCGGDHDWEAFSAEDGATGSSAAVRWYTSHTCDRAKVAVDYFCPPSLSNGNKKELHRCTFKGESTVVTDKANSWCSFPNSSPTAAESSERHAGDPAPGYCVEHAFDASECTNGLPADEDDCIASRKRVKECGAEQDWTIVGPTGEDQVLKGVDETYERMNRAAGVMWYNGLETGPCGDAELTVDYFCPAK